MTTWHHIPKDHDLTFKIYFHKFYVYKVFLVKPVVSGDMDISCYTIHYPFINMFYKCDHQKFLYQCTPICFALVSGVSCLVRQLFDKEVLKSLT